MKKLMWIFAVIPVVVTGIVLQFLPDEIPLHYDIEGNVDSWGSKGSSFIFPVMILGITLFWHLLIHVYEKKSVSAKTEKEQMEAKSATKVLTITGILMAIMFGVMHYCILYSSYQVANEMTETKIDIARITCILMGVFIVILGNFMPKAKKNAMVGVRISWSMYNDNTWRKSNYFGAVAMIIAGILTIITACFTKGIWATLMFLGYLFAAMIAILVYSKKVYDKEKAKKA